MTDMLIVATAELCHPIALIILAETGDRSLHRPRLAVLSGRPAVAPPFGRH